MRFDNRLLLHVLTFAYAELLLGHAGSAYAEDAGVASLGAHACAIDGERLLRCWGNNDVGQLGDGTRSSRTAPQPVSGLTDVTAVTTGRHHTCAIARGEAYCWGGNADGELGIGVGGDSAVPRRVRGLPTSVRGLAISAGTHHTCALAGGRAYCWGSNLDGALGVPEVKASDSPLAVSSFGADASVSDISAGDRHSCAVVNGRAWCWGDNEYGTLGDGTRLARRQPVPVSGELGDGLVDQVSAGGFHSCARATHRLYCWGDNTLGQLGNGSREGSLLPSAVRGDFPGPVDQVDAGAYHACALSAGQALCWGSNHLGQLGNGRLEDSLAPTRVSTISTASPVLVIDAGPGHTCLSAIEATACRGNLENARSAKAAAEEAAASWSGTSKAGASSASSSGR